MPKPISVQLYSVRDECAKDFFGTIRRVSDIGFAAVEFAGFYDKPVAEVAKVLRDAGLKASGLFVGLPTKDDIKKTADDARALGATYLTTGFGPNDMETEEGARGCADKLSKASDLARGEGLSLCMHNHWWEFSKEFGSRTAFEVIMDAAPNVLSELDMYWVAKGGKDPVAVARKWKKRIPAMHVKDGDLGEEPVMKALGTGKVPVKEVLKEVDGPDFKWPVVEFDNCATDMMTAVRESYGYLTSNGLAQGRK